MRSLFHALLALFLAVSCANIQDTSAGPKAGGVVVDKDGDPVKNAAVYAYDLEHVPWVGDTGIARVQAWDITGGDGRYTLEFSLAGLSNILITAPDGKTVLVDSVVIGRDGTTQVPDAVVGKPGSIAGTVVLAGKSDTVRPQITAYLPGTNLAVPVDTGSGSYEISGVPAGTYRVVFTPGRPEFTGATLFASVAADSTAVLDTFVMYSSFVTGVPEVDAGPDTLVPPGGTILLHPTVRDTFGSIADYAWAFDDAVFYSVAVDSTMADTMLDAPSKPDSQFLCILRVTDNDSNQVFDTVKVTVGTVSQASLDSLCLRDGAVGGWLRDGDCAAYDRDSVSDSIVAGSDVWKEFGMQRLLAQQLYRPVDSLLADSVAGDTVEIRAMDFAVPESASAMFAHADTTWVTDSLAIVLSGYPDSLAVIMPLTGDTIVDTAAQDTTVEIYYVLRARLNRFYFKMTFFGLADSADIDTTVGALLLGYERRL
ncbi:MAG: hypothetical protein GF418_13370 [Chitinivibrionales bacterium]|nr:hypothetical protein [Chitinivibrionales bacterium]MBD3396609.1 hypothetical protein [Chitinivibrionales bacterium]